MKNFYINKIDEPWRTEIAERIGEGFDFEGTVAEFSQKGYLLQNSGVMLREPLKAITSHIPDSTILDIAFCRKSDIHQHTRIGELVRVLSGSGSYYFNKTKAYAGVSEMTVCSLHPDITVYVPPMIPHAFVPGKDTHLEISLATLGGKLGENEDEELTVEPFNKWAPLHLTLPPVRT